MGRAYSLTGRPLVSGTGNPVYVGGAAGGIEAPGGGSTEEGTSRGSLVHGESFVLVGSGFGTKSATFKYDDFRGGSAGADLANGWAMAHVAVPGPAVHPTYNVTQVRGGASLASVRLYFGGSIGQSECSIRLSGINSSQVYFDWWMKYVCLDTNTFATNYKRLSVYRTDGLYPGVLMQGVYVATGGASAGVHLASSFAQTVASQSETATQPQIIGPAKQIQTQLDANSRTIGPEGPIQHNVWTHHQLAMQLNSASGVMDGKVRFYRDHALIRSFDNWLECNGGTLFPYDLFYLGHYSYGTTPNGHEVYLANVCVDRSWARVEIGNAATYATCTLREIQPVTAWTDTAIAITANQGTLTRGVPVYVYVLDQTNTQVGSAVEAEFA